jgi:hypothetical protein
MSWGEHGTGNPKDTPLRPLDRGDFQRGSPYRLSSAIEHENGILILFIVFVSPSVFSQEAEVSPGNANHSQAGTDCRSC